MQARVSAVLLAAAICLCAGARQVAAQAATGFENPYYTTGTRIAPSTLVPALRKWYLPQRLYSIYGWKPEEYTNYARQPYEIYSRVALEGAPYYDQYGQYITRGWEIYSWTEDYPTNNGSNIYKDPFFSGWFSNIVIASSHSGQYHSSLMVGDAIRSSLTPLTFSKPRFDGVQWDFLSDKYGATVLASRVSHTGVLANNSGDPPISVDPFSDLYGLRGQAQVGDFARFGLTFVNVAHRTTDLGFGENSLKGVLAGPLNADFVRTIIVQVSDDSPEDGEGGALLSRWRLFADGVDHTEDIAPTIEGGVRRRGLIEASGTDVVTLTFNLEDFSPGVDDEIDDFRQIRVVEIGLVLANDYRVEVTSNKQTNSVGTPVFLPVLRASGNVQDGSNQGYHQFRYGLPTGNRLLGFSLDVDDLGGFNLRGEVVRNNQYRRFPNENIESGQALAQEDATAFYVTAQQHRYPWTVFAEVFSTDADYSTSAFIPNANGEVFYDNQAQSFYELVDDNDDQDELPDWTRQYRGPATNTRFGRNLRVDDAVFPGRDENNDDISDFNRNYNDIPDYAEAFLRFEVDPPEFLFGLDMNNNAVIDRFEDDTEADYPYKRGHQGYNAYAGVELFPGSNLSVGRLDQRLLKTDRTSLGHYLLLTLKKELPRHNLRAWLIANPRLVEDDIPDDVLLWDDALGTRGDARFVRDPLAARDAFINTSYLEVAYDRFLPFTTKVKHEIFHLRDGDEELRDQTFLGVLNKAEYPLEVQRWTLLPRWKQLYGRTTPASREERRTVEVTEILSFLVHRQINREITFTGGTEYELFRNLRARPDPLPPGYLEDADTWVLAGQIGNTAEYHGYRVTSNVGVQWSRRDADAAKAASELSSFIRVFAGLGTER
ncbi:MAG: hypothetical protein AB1505_10320 [Candidatus Latescibacterota bacterium]